METKRGGLLLGRVGKRSKNLPATFGTLLTRVGDGPMLQPTNRWWESVAVYNPGVAEGPDGIIHLLYRAQGRDGISRLGYARSRDGVTVDARSAEPVFEPDLHNTFERSGIEDPRLMRFGDTYYVIYTAASLYEHSHDPHPGHGGKQEFLEPPWRVRVALTTTNDFRSFTRRGLLLPEVDNKDAVLFPEKIGGRYMLLHRLAPDIWISTSDNLRQWEEHRIVLRTRPAIWDERRLGAGPPPVRTEAGWLLCYHGSDHHNVYRLGFALLDLEDPALVLGRSAEAALEPSLPWELHGQVPRVVFPSGMVRRGDELLVYYGAADTVVGVARGSVSQIVSALRTQGS